MQKDISAEVRAHDPAATPILTNAPWTSVELEIMADMNAALGGKLFPTNAEEHRAFYAAVVRLVNAASEGGA